MEKYGATWKPETDPLFIEMECIRQGGEFTQKGNKCGKGLSFHYEAMRHRLWPDLDDHRWSSLCRDEVINNRVSVLMGPASSGKTHTPAWIYLCAYWCRPQETCVLVSSTDFRGLELRVWGEIKMLFEEAKRRYPALDGYLIDSKHCICTDNVDEDTSRDLRKGIIGIPCVMNGKFVGLGKYSGIKQTYVYLIADEAQFMGASFLSAFANLDKNDNFNACILGNPNDILDPLGKAAEPLDGWDGHMEPTKTTTWKTRFMNGTCVNLIGTDSPNNDFPSDKPDKYPYLISRRKIANTLSFFPKDSVEYYSQCVGAMKIGLISKRVISRDLCRKFKAGEDVVWLGIALTKIYGLDSAYGGDRCIGGYCEFGQSADRDLIFNVVRPSEIPILVNGTSPEDQISARVMTDCLKAGIPPENMFHDATGRGSLGTSLARIWSAQTNPVEFGGIPTNRPVCLDMYVKDPKTGQKRLKTCVEHYVKFVSELWYSVRYVIECGQMRGLPEDVMDEGCMRQWALVYGNKICIETKEEMKDRTGRSPDLFDWLSICVEGARRRGFNIKKMAGAEDMASLDWLDDLRRKQRERAESHQLTYQ